MGRVLAFVYGLAAYAVFFVTFLYAIGFVGNLIVPKAIDTGAESPLATALAVDALLLMLFAVQHSVMARPGFKRWWTQIVPRSIERSTFVLVSSLVLLLMYWQWRPLSATVWSIGNPAAAGLIWAFFWIGWLTVLLSTYMIDHFDLFGLRQVYLNLKNEPCRPLDFSTRGLYRFVRHPIMLGFIVAFWAAPHMTLGHLVFAIATTGYILVALLLEERDLVAFHGRAYEAYKQQVWMLLPISKVQDSAAKGRPAK
jgi:methanethiol S-methyltransferase